VAVEGSSVISASGEAECKSPEVKRLVMKAL
jgi:hypothetical protein